MRRPRGRWAPSPTGELHVGNARTALVAWWSVRSAGGTMVVRIEDLDPPRVVPGTARRGLEDLAWLGLDWDEGPGARNLPEEASESGARDFPSGAEDGARDLPREASESGARDFPSGAEDGARDFPPEGGEGARDLSQADRVGAGKGAFGPYWQSLRGELYESALDHLAARGRLFPCPLSRKDLRQLASAPHDGAPVVSPYPRHLRPEAFQRGTLEPGWLGRVRERWGAGLDPEVSLRFAVEPGQVRFEDHVMGEGEQRVDEAVGDFVLRRRDGLWAYQLAVVVDDLLMEIDEVVRGADLLGSTARQIQLIRALEGWPVGAREGSEDWGQGSRVPGYAHVPLVLNERGEKLSKRDRGLTLASLRQGGVHPEALVGYLAWTLGLLPSPRRASVAELLHNFRWPRLSREDWVLEPDLAQTLRSL
ncbi:MAG: glutamate--tRNA ligase family protein [Acidobacteriota bacterium]